jgi:CRP-like cAMP-binding protein
LGEQQTNGPVLEITRKNLAAISGVAIESLIRTLSNFKDEHLIDIEPGKIIILNENKLRDMPN